MIRTFFKRLFLLLVVFAIGINIYAQAYKDGCADIEGIVLGAHPSLEDMVECFGNDYMVEHLIVDEVGPYDLMVYKFEGVELSIDSQYGLILFVLKSKKLHALTSYGIEEGVIIGDLWDAFLKAGYPVYSMYESKANGKGEKKI